MRHAHTISWMLFALLGVATILLSLASVYAAYFDSSGDLIAGRFTPAEVANGDEELAAALSARRGTAAAFALSYGILLLGIALRPYRREGRALPWLLAGTLANAAVILLRGPLLGVGLGLMAGLMPLVLVVVAAIFGAIAHRHRTASA